MVHSTACRSCSSPLLDPSPSSKSSPSSSRRSHSSPVLALSLSEAQEHHSWAGVAVGGGVNTQIILSPSTLSEERQESGNTGVHTAEPLCMQTVAGIYQIKLMTLCSLWSASPARRRWTRKMVSPALQSPVALPPRDPPLQHQEQTQTSPTREHPHSSRSPFSQSSQALLLLLHLHQQQPLQQQQPLHLQQQQQQQHQPLHPQEVEQQTP